MEKDRNLESFRFSLIVFVILIVISGTILSLSSGGFIVSFKEVGFSFFTTVQKGVNTAFKGVTGAFEAVKELKQLRQDYNLLLDKLRDYEYLQRANVDIRKENEILKEQLNISKSIMNKNYVAQVIGRDPDNLYSGITINKGSSQGIKKNMPVIAVQNSNIGLVGKVVTVGRFTCQVMPVYDFQCNISARIQKTRDVGLLTGQGSSEVPLQMQYIKNRVKDEIQYGDVIVTSGENENYLKDIAIGNITKIDRVDYDSSLKIEVTPIIDFSRLENVIVVDVKKFQEVE